MGYKSRRKKLYSIVLISFAVIAAAIAIFVVFIMSKNKTIKFENCDLNPIHLKQGSVIESLPDITKYGYDFKGWYYDKFLTQDVKLGEDRIIENISLYPRFEKGVFTISFDISGGNGSVEPITREFETPIVLPTANTASLSKIDEVYGDLNLKYWTTEPNGSGSLLVPGTIVNVTGENVTYYAYWRRFETIVKYFPNGGGYVVEATYFKGEKVPESGRGNTQIRTGYVFETWCWDEEGLLPVDFNNYILDQDEIKLYAKWNPIEFNVKFYLDVIDYRENKTPFITNKIYFDGNVTKPPNPTNPAKPNLYFKQWVVGIPNSETEMGPSSPFIFSTKVNKNYILIGLWTTELIIDDETPASAFEYVVNAQNKVIINGLKSDSNTLTSITIPRQIEQKDVVSINGISSNTSLTKVVLPYTIETITDNAFDNCPNIISYGFSSTNEKFKAVDGVIYSADGKKLYRYPSAKLGDLYETLSTTENIIAKAFNYSKYLKTLNINAIILENGALNNANSITKLILNNNLTTIADAAFQDCNNLTEIQINNNNKFSVRNGILYEVKSGVNYKVIKCFNKTENLEIVLDEFVTDIQAFAFHKCANIKSLTIGANVVNYGVYSLFSMLNLETLKFLSTSNFVFGSGIIYGEYSTNYKIYAYLNSPIWDKIYSSADKSHLFEL